MQRKTTVGEWCGRWYRDRCGRWSESTANAYRSLIRRHIDPGIGGVALDELTAKTVGDFYSALRERGLGERSVWCVHLLLRRCVDEAARERLIPFNPVRLCAEPRAGEYTPTPLRLGQVRRYLNAAEQLGVLPIIYIGLSSGLRQGELFALSWADFRGRQVIKGSRILALNAKAAALLPPKTSPLVFPNPRTGEPYKLHEFRYLHSKILKLARLPRTPFRDLQLRCMEAGL